MSETEMNNVIPTRPSKDWNDGLVKIIGLRFEPVEFSINGEMIEKDYT